MEEFFAAAVEFILGTTVIANYANGTEETQRRYIERVTIELCKAYSPRKNYDISKDTIREFVGEVLAQEAERYESAKNQFGQI